MTKDCNIDFLEGATNVYRTENYIVRQHIGVKVGIVEPDVLFSYDTYYARTALRDRQYECIFSDKRQINGKRMRTSMYSRTYIE